MTQWYMTALIIIVILAVFFLTVMIIDGNRFRVVEYQLYSSKVKKEHRYVVLSDLHNKSYGEKNSRLIRKIIGLTPEGILIAGDILTAKPGKSYEVALELIKNLAEKYPIYYGPGNHETRLFLYPETYGDMGERYLADLNKVSVDFLKNESQQCEDNIRITGLDMDRNYYKRLKKYPMDSNYLKETLGEADKQKYEVLLAHNPDYFEEYAEWGADLVLSGHVHGGMMRLPVLGGVISPSVKLFPKYDGGIFKIGKSTMILSRGLGMHTIPIRLFNPAEIVVVELEGET